jgi:hypothetical protein
MTLIATNNSHRRGAIFIVPFGLILVAQTTQLAQIFVKIATVLTPL